jgi:hypothetical protein
MKSIFIKEKMIFIASKGNEYMNRFSNDKYHNFFKWKKKYKTNRKLDMDNEGLDRRRWERR